MTATVNRARLGRAGWHRRTGLVPVGYLAGIVAVAVAHPFVPQGRWLMIHLLLLGAVTNAILIWGAHFTAAILRTATGRRRAETVRLLVLNAGVLAVLAGGSLGPAWLGVTAAAAVFAALAAHLWALARRLRAALPARFAVTVHYYLTAGVALLAGIPAGAWMLVLDDAHRPRLLLFHAHVNLLGFVTLTVLGTLLTLWPSVLRTRMLDGASRATSQALPVAVARLARLAVGTLASWPHLAVTGLAAFAAAVVLVVVPAAATARRRPPRSFAAWSVGAALGWLLVALAWDAVSLLTAHTAAVAADRFDTILLPLGGGFAAQILLGALSYLLPVALDGGPAAVCAHTAWLDAYGAQRVTMTNLALAVYLLPSRRSSASPRLCCCSPPWCSSSCPRAAPCCPERGDRLYDDSVHIGHPGTGDPAALGRRGRRRRPGPARRHRRCHRPAHRRRRYRYDHGRGGAGHRAHHHLRRHRDRDALPARPPHRRGR